MISTNRHALIFADTMLRNETRMSMTARNYRRLPVCYGRHRWIRLGLLRATSIAVLISCSSLASAKTDIRIPSLDADVSVDTTVTAGVGVRTTHADRRLIGKSFDSSGRPKGGIGTDVNEDGNLNYSKGDVFTAPVQAFSRVTMTHDDYRLVASARAWADFETLYGEIPQGNIPNGYRANARLSDRGFNRLNRFAGVRLWEAYASGTWKISPSASVDAKVGRSVLNWSISKSFNAQGAITPIDLSAARMPGVVARDEVAIPTGMLNLSATVDGATVGGFYQFERSVDNLPACGTFFGVLDVGFDAGCSGLSANTFFPTPASALPADAARYDNDAFGLAAGAVLPRKGDVYIGVHSQFGISAAFKPVAGLDVRIYFLNLASRLPYITAITGDVAAFQRPDPIFVAAGAPAGYAGTASFLKTAGYRFDYPGNIRTFGANFTFTQGGNTVGAQVDFSDNLPVQLNTADVIEQIFGAGPLVPRVLGMPPGSFSNGYDRLRSLNLMVTASMIFRKY